MASSQCQNMQSRLVDYEVGEEVAVEAELQELQQHLEQCSDCRAVADELRGTGLALEAVRKIDDRLNDQVRKNITSRARVEAELVRVTREHDMVKRPAAKVPVAAWIVLGVGILGAMIGVIYLSGRKPVSGGGAASVLYSQDSSGGASMAGDSIEYGRKVVVKAGTIMSLTTSNDSEIDVRGPAEFVFGKGENWLALSNGCIWLRPGADVKVVFGQLDSLEVAEDSEVILSAYPQAEIAAKIVVLSGEVRYSSAAGADFAKAGSCITVSGKTQMASSRNMNPDELAHWRNEIPDEYRR
jgi:hypothetical protein